MERDQLIRLLFGGSETHSMCHDAVRSGAPYKIWDRKIPAGRLALIYGRRWRHVQRTGQPSIGFEEAVLALKSYAGDELMVGYVDDRFKGGYYFQIFLEPGCSEMVACLGVKRTKATK
ncbi:hypothetical protein GCM10027187_58570 [Streptosporangium sandarakinum]